MNIWKKIYQKKEKLEEKRSKFLQEIGKQKRELDDEEVIAFKELRDAQGVLSLKEFVNVFYEALSDKMKAAINRYDYSVGETPYCMGYDNTHLYIVRNVQLCHLLHA